MNGSQNRYVVDTNVIFMSLYGPKSKAGKIIKFAIERKIDLYAPDSVREEITRVLAREFSFTKEKIEEIISALPITWIEKQIYEIALDKTKVKHFPDKPVEALAIILNCGIISADAHFKNRLDINKLIEEIEKI